MEETEDKFLKQKKYNVKLYPVYKMFAWDLLFYYSISFLFFTQVKGITASQILFIDSFYPLFKLVLQIPCVNIVEHIGKRKSVILGNVLISASIMVVIFCKTIPHIILVNFLMAFGYSLKSLCESTILNNCITDKEHPRTAFSNVDGKGSAYWYYFDAITASSCGFLYVFNNYLPMILSFVMSIIACILSLKFLPYEDKSKKEILHGETRSFKVYFKDLKIAFKSILKSNRLKALLLFSGIFAALLTVRSTMASSLFTEIEVPEQYFGIIFAFLTFTSGIAAKHQDYFHKTYKNKVLTYFSLTYSISMIIAGIVAIFFREYKISFILIFVCYALQYIIKGPYLTLQKRYLNSFSTPTMSTKIYSACLLIESIFNTLIYWICAILLDFVSTSFAITVLGCVFTILFLFTLDYMRDKLGLKPEEYRDSDIHLTEVH